MTMAICFHANAFEHCSSACVLIADTTHHNRERGELKQHCDSGELVGTHLNTGSVSAFAWGLGAVHNEGDQAQKTHSERKFEAVAQPEQEENGGKS